MTYSKQTSGAVAPWRTRLVPMILIGALAGTFIYAHIRARILYAGVEIGMSRTAVIEHLGQPRRVESEILFCAPYMPWSGECPGPRPGTEFLHFKFGIDRWIIVGVEQTGTVWFKTLGDT